MRVEQADVPGDPSCGCDLSRQERRAHVRRTIDEHGELIIPSENMILPCRVVNISAGGAKVMCDALPPSGSKITLVMSSGKRFEGVTTRYGKGELGLQFSAPAKD